MRKFLLIYFGESDTILRVLGEVEAQREVDQLLKNHDGRLPHFINESQLSDPPLYSYLLAELGPRGLIQPKPVTQVTQWSIGGE